MATQQMSVTMTGFAATHPARHRTIPKLVTFRMASTPSWNDNGEWKDAGTLFIEVQCWGRLADNVLTGVVTGAPLVIAGRMNSYSYVPENPRTNKDGKEVPETVWRLTATNVGLDLSHSVSTWSLRDRIREPQDGQGATSGGGGAGGAGGVGGAGGAEASSFGGFSAVAEGDGDGAGGAASGDADQELATAGDSSAPF
ncbi:single-stranded DNA-binding protein [Corynebacterium kalidii]